MRHGRVVFVDRQVVGLLFAIGEGDAVGGFGTGDDDLAHAHFQRRLEHVVGAHGVDPEGLVVGRDQDARDRGEMHHRVEGGHAGAGLELVEIGIHAHRVEHLSRIRDIGDQVVDAGVIERHEVDVHHPMPLRHQVGQHFAPRLATATGEENAHLVLLFCHYAPRIGQEPDTTCCPGCARMI